VTVIEAPSVEEESMQFRRMHRHLHPGELSASSPATANRRLDAVRPGKVADKYRITKCNRRPNGNKCLSVDIYEKARLQVHTRDVTLHIIIGPSVGK